MEFLTLTQTAERLQLSKATIDRILREDPTFPARKVRGQWRIKSDALNSWWDQQQKAGPPAANITSISQYITLNVPKSASKRRR